MSDVTSIENHEGKKYIKNIRDAITGGLSIKVDVYAVLKAFDVTCSARAHAIKKLLCAGQRGKGDAVADLIGARAAIDRAILLEMEPPTGPPILRPPTTGGVVLSEKRRTQIGVVQ